MNKPKLKTTPLTIGRTLVLLSCACVALVAGELQLRSTHAGEGAHIGNGGGGWTCREPNGALRWVRLLDLDEGRREFISRPASIPYDDPSADGDRYVARTETEWLRYAERRIMEANPSFYAQYRIARDLVMSRQKPVEGSLFMSTDDFAIRTKPDAEIHCPGGVIPMAPEQIANYNEEIGMLELNAQLWDSKRLRPIDRAALTVHEAIYYLFRHKAKQRDSVKTRKVVAHLFSDMAVRDFYPLLSNDKLLPEGEWNVQLGKYNQIKPNGHDFAPVMIDSFSTQTGYLKLRQVNGVSGKTYRWHEFRCDKRVTVEGTDREPEQYKYVCAMKSVRTSGSRLTRWYRNRKARSRIDNHELQIGKNEFVWLNTRGSGITWETLYHFEPAPIDGDRIR